ncbi:MAG: energy transducer TonB [Rhodothermia bacterium]|nr:energy transducer TonB [Rhodothermia bacterium]
MVATVALVLLATASCSSSRIDSDTVTMPVLKEATNLRYPMDAQMKRQEGVVRMRLFISEKGLVSKTRIVQSSGFAQLDEAAIQYASGLQFTPATRNGRPEPALIGWRVRFEIEDTSAEAIAYVEKVVALYDIATATPLAVQDAARAVLDEHESFASTSTDAMSVNEYIKLVIRADTDSDYTLLWGSCPLRFVLFDDYLRRFPDVEPQRAVGLLQRFAAEDATYIQQLCFVQPEREAKSTQVLATLRTVLGQRYPTLVLPEERVAP